MDRPPEIRLVRATLRGILRLLQFYQWRCSSSECRALNTTWIGIWSAVKYRLICGRCQRMQSYPDYIREQDPERN